MRKNLTLLTYFPILFITLLLMGCDYELKKSEFFRLLGVSIYNSHLEVVKLDVIRFDENYNTPVNYYAIIKFHDSSYARFFYESLKHEYRPNIESSVYDLDDKIGLNINACGRTHEIPIYWLRTAGPYSSNFITLDGQLPNNNNWSGKKMIHLAGDSIFVFVEVLTCY